MWNDEIIDVIFDRFFFFFDFLLPTVGESNSGKAPKLVARHIPGPSAQLDALGNRASTAASEISRAHQLAVERGENLSKLEDRTARMMTEAEQFSNNARELLMKNKDKRWYQL